MSAPGFREVRKGISAQASPGEATAIHGSDYEFSGFGFRVSGSKFSGSGFRVSGSFRVSGKLGDSTSGCFG